MNEKKPSVFSRNVIRVGTIGAFLPKRLKLFWRQVSQEPIRFSASFDELHQRI